MIMIASEIIVEGNKDFLDACLQALKPEEEFKTARAGYSLSLGKALKIKIAAEDATAFRAVMTTITGLLSVIEKGWKHGK
jgi:tRNA threonylcarbamoyladenosine modification (KEOPS) complex  Pcc1 subunit